MIITCSFCLNRHQKQVKMKRLRRGKLHRWLMVCRQQGWPKIRWKQPQNNANDATISLAKAGCGHNLILLQFDLMSFLILVYNFRQQRLTWLRFNCVRACVCVPAGGGHLSPPRGPGQSVWGEDFLSAGERQDPRILWNLQEEPGGGKGWTD